MQNILCVPRKLSRKNPVVLPKPMPKIATLELDLLDSGGYGKPIQHLVLQKVLVQSEKLAMDHDDEEGLRAMRKTHDTSLVKLIVNLTKEEEGNKVLSAISMGNNTVYLANTAAKAANAYKKRTLLAKVQELQKQLQQEVDAERAEEGFQPQMRAGR